MSLFLQRWDDAVQHFSVTPVNSGCVFVCNVNIYHVWVYKTCTRRNTHTHSPYTHVLRLVSFYLDLFQFNFRVEHQRGGGERGGTNVRGDEEPTERTSVGGRQEDGRDRRLPDGGSCFGNGSRRASFFVFSDDDIVLSSTVECT